jgi:hypothetical protein
LNGSHTGTKDIYLHCISYEGDQALKLADSVLEKNLKSKVQNNKDLMRMRMHIALTSTTIQHVGNYKQDTA